MTKFFTNVLAIILASFFVACEKDSSNNESHKDKKLSAIFTGTDLHGVATPKNLKALVQLASQNLSETAPSVFLIGGDCAGDNTDSLVNNEIFSLSSVIDVVEKGSRSKRNRYFFTYGSHDSECTDGYSSFFSGPAALDNYYLYGISFSQMSVAEDTLVNQNNGLNSLDDFGKDARSASAKFLTWAKALQDHAPIVIMSHMPIHANRGDNLGGKIWCDAINEVAQNHDIFFLYGHNHTIEHDPYDSSHNNLFNKFEIPGDTAVPPIGDVVMEDQPKNMGDENSKKNENASPYNEQDFYLVLPGSILPVQTSEKSVLDSLKINFTYLNAGYFCCGYASKITFNDVDNDGNYDNVNIKRYTVRDTTIAYFGNTGIKNPYTCNLTFGKK